MKPSIETATSLPMKILTLALDDSPDAALFLALVRESSFITAVREEEAPAAAPTILWLWRGDPSIDPAEVFAGLPGGALSSLADIRRADWDQRARLEFLNDSAAAAADDSL